MTASVRWIKHLEGLAELENNSDKKVAFLTSADIIFQCEESEAELTKENEQLKARVAELEKEVEDLQYEALEAFERGES